MANGGSDSSGGDQQRLGRLWSRKRLGSAGGGSATAQAETGMRRATAWMALATAQAETGVQTGARTAALVAALITAEAGGRTKGVKG